MASQKIITNDYLSNSILGYLSPKDLSTTCQVNRRMNKLTNNFNAYWREECNEHFCSTYENNK